MVFNALDNEIDPYAKDFCGACYFPTSGNPTDCTAAGGKEISRLIMGDHG